MRFRTRSARRKARHRTARRVSRRLSRQIDGAAEVSYNLSFLERLQFTPLGNGSIVSPRLLDIRLERFERAVTSELELAGHSISSEMVTDIRTGDQPHVRKLRRCRLTVVQMTPHPVS